MKRSLAVPVLLLLILAPASTALTVTPAEITASDGTVLARWTEDDPGTLQLQAKHIGGILSDTVKEDRIDARGTKLAPLENATGDGGTYPRAIPSGAGHLSLVRSEDTTVLIRPISDDFRTSLAASGDILLRSVKNEVLESNHAFDDPDAELDSSDNYVYRVHDVVAARAGTAADIRVDGDFILYVWGATILQETPEDTLTHFAGTWREAGSAPGLQDIHYQHALFVVRDGHLRLGAPQGATLYAPELTLHPNTQDGLLDLATSPGIVLATLDGDRVSLQATAAPAFPTPLATASASILSWGLPLAALAALAAAATPNVLGRHHTCAGRLLDRLCAARAHGYRRLALHAERRRHPGLAALWMGRAAHWDTDPELRMQQGIYLRLAGRHARALRIHHVADQAFRADGVVHALNSYEAARAAARTGRLDEAIQWLLSAVREESWLARKAPFEPDLAPLRPRPEFMDLRFAADPDGLLRP